MYSGNEDENFSNVSTSIRYTSSGLSVLKKHRYRIAIWVPIARHTDRHPIPLRQSYVVFVGVLDYSDRVENEPLGRLAGRICNYESSALHFLCEDPRQSPSHDFAGKGAMKCRQVIKSGQDVDERRYVCDSVFPSVSFIEFLEIIFYGSRLD